jgi:small subunit ribosomal protein S17
MVTERKTAEKKPAKETRPAKAAVVKVAKVDTRSSLEKRRMVVGTVVSDKMQKTIVVRVERRVKHDFYKKYVKKFRHLKAHDEKNDSKIGDLVRVVESRPLSKDKRWALQAIVRRAGQAPEANV